MTDALDWAGRVGDNWATEWERTDRSFAPLNAILVDRIVAQAGASANALDIGCGAGGTSMDVAARLPDATICGIDLSPALIEVAVSRNPLPARLSFAQADATQWSGGEWRPDLLFSRHGVMFFDDPVGAFSHLAGQAAPGACLVFSCFRSPSENAWASEIAALLPEQPRSNPLAPGPFAFADPGHVARILAGAGWRDAVPEAVDFTYIAGAGEDPVADALDFFRRIGPAARALAALPPDEREAFRAKLEPLLSRHHSDGTVNFDAAAWIWTAHL